MLAFLFQIFQWIVRSTIGSFIPIGNENSTVRRIPLVTFSIMVLCVLVYFVTLPGEATALKKVINAGVELERFLEQNAPLVVDDEVRHKLLEKGLITKPQAEAVTDQLKQNPGLTREYDSWLRGAEVKKLREEFNEKLAAFLTAREGRIANQFGLAPNGKWKLYQFVTYAFLHEVPIVALLPEHLLYNMVFFFAVAFVLEDLWGRGTLLAFYLMRA